jgi:hypothetical protein
MKYTAFLALIVAACAAGCDKPQPQPRQSGYDKKVDGSVALPAVASGKTILTGGGLPYTPIARVASAQPASAPASAPATDSVAQVKAVVAEVFAAVDAGQSVKVLAYMPSEQAKVVKPLFEFSDSTAAARLQVERAVVARFGEAYVPRMRSVLNMPRWTSQVRILPDAPDNLSYEAAGDKVEVRAAQSAGTDKPSLSFVLTSGKWEMHLPMLEQTAVAQALDVNGPGVAALKTAANVETQLYTTIGQGIQNGTIASENFDVRLAAIKQQYASQLIVSAPGAAPAAPMATPAQPAGAPQARLGPPQGNQGAGELESQINTAGTMQLMGAP